MVADNDLALGRIVKTISHTFWPHSVIFVDTTGFYRGRLQLICGSRRRGGNKIFESRSGRQFLEFVSFHKFEQIPYEKYGRHAVTDRVMYCEDQFRLAIPLYQHDAQ